MSDSSSQATEVSDEIPCTITDDASPSKVLVEIDLEAMQDFEETASVSCPSSASASSPPPPTSQSSSSSPSSSSSTASDSDDTAEVHHNRSMMTILHFMLTYPKYSISLFVLFANLTTPLPRASEQVVDPFRNLQQVVQTEASLYYECVEQGFEQAQNINLEQAAQTEAERVRSNRETFHTQTLAGVSDLTDHCSRHVTRVAQRSLQEWNLMKQAVPLRQNSTTTGAICTAADRGMLYGGILQGNTTVHKLQDLLDTYIAASLENLQALVEYSNERSDYDQDFFVELKMKAVLSILNDLSLPQVKLFLPESEILLELRVIMQGLLDALRGAYFRIDELMIRIKEFEASLGDFYLNYLDMHGRFELATAFTLTLVPPGTTLPDYFNISDLPSAYDLLPASFTIPLLNTTLPDIEDLVSEYLVKALELIHRVLQEAALEASEETREAAEKIMKLLKDLMTLEDYEPPTYPRSQGIKSPDDALEQLQVLAAQTKKAAVNALREIYKPTEIHVEPPTTDWKVLPLNLTEQDPKEFTFLEFGMPEIVIPVWLLTIFGYLVSRTFLIECVTQAVRLYRLKRKYEKNGIPNLPEIDYYVGTEHDDDDEKDSKNSKLQMAQVMLLRNVMNPWIIAGLVILPFAVFILFFWFPHVKATCIDTRRGTYLARNVFKQIQVNKANSQGYSLHTQAQQNCHRRQRTICGRMSTETDASYRSDIQALYSLELQFNSSRLILGVLDRCMDVDDLDAAFQLHCCGLEGYASANEDCSLEQNPEICPIDSEMEPPEAFSPIGEALLEDSCQSELGKLEVDDDTLFNCSVLTESCNDVPCHGVDADLILDMTIEADCRAEIYGIRVCLFIAMTIFHAILINICNALLFNGVLQIRWKTLNPEGIKLMTHVTSNGELAKGGDINERSDRIKKAMDRFVMAGWVQVGLSAFIFVFWLVSFAVLRRTTNRFAMYHD